ncbi:MAG: PEP-CTERM sorting domain-containing protein [Planctomycetaceae bacterium]
MALSCLATGAQGAPTITGTTFRYAVTTVFDPDAGKYVASTSNAKAYKDPYLANSSFWAPVTPGKGEVTLQFSFANPVISGSCFAHFYAANFGGASGKASFWGSTDGSSWELLMDVPTPTDVIAVGPDYRGLLPRSFLGSRSLWFQARMESTGNALWAQFMRNTGRSIEFPAFGLTAEMLPEPVLPASYTAIHVPSDIKTQRQAGYGRLFSTTAFVKTGTGTLVLDQANEHTEGMAVRDGKIRLAHSAALGSSALAVLAGAEAQIAPDVHTTLAGLTVSGSARFDVTTGRVTVSSGLTENQLVAQIIAGRNGGDWQGASGITSSIAAAFVNAGENRAVGWLDNGDGSFTFGYAVPGDTNLDECVDILDVANLLGGGKADSGAVATWADGDFNYDGNVDVLDIAEFTSSGLLNAGSYARQVGPITAVPEPGTLGLLSFFCALGGLAMRRRRSAG